MPAQIWATWDCELSRGDIAGRHSAVGSRRDQRVSQAAAARARTSREKADELRNLSAFTTWSGDAAEAAQEAITDSRTKLELSAQEDSGGSGCQPCVSGG